MSTDDRPSSFTREYPRGALIFRDGDAGHDMYVIQSGKVRIAKTVRGVDTTLGILGSGEFFGEMSILNNKPRSATATVAEDAKLMVISPKMFETMLRENTEIAVRMIKKLSARLEEADEQIATLLLQDASSRVVHALLNLSKHEVENDPAGQSKTVRLGITVQDLSGKVGLDTTAVTIILQKLLRGNLIEMSDQSLLIHDTDKMRGFLNFLEMKEKYGNISL